MFSLGHLSDVILTFGLAIMRAEQWIYNKQIFKVTKIANVYTYQMSKLRNNFNIEAECMERKKERNEKMIRFLCFIIPFITQRKMTNCTNPWYGCLKAQVMLYILLNTQRIVKGQEETIIHFVHGENNR